MTWFNTMLDDHLAVPFQTVMLDVGVTVERIDMANGEPIVAFCTRRKSCQRVPILGPAAARSTCGRGMRSVCR
jgi:hypothetical protein